MQLHVTHERDQFRCRDERRVRSRVHDQRQRLLTHPPTPTPTPTPTSTPTGTSCTTTATSDISADCYSSSKGTIDVTSATGDTNPSGVDGNQVAQLANGDYLEYTGVNFGSGGSTQFD